MSWEEPIRGGTGKSVRENALPKFSTMYFFTFTTSDRLLPTHESFWRPTIAVAESSRTIKGRIEERLGCTPTRSFTFELWMLMTILVPYHQCFCSSILPSILLVLSATARSQYA